MSLRKQFMLYWVLLHAAFAGVMFVLLKNDRVWLLGVEALILVSLFIALRLQYKLYKPLQLVQHGVELVRDNFTAAAFTLTGNKEVDTILEAYNLMLSALRKERLRMQEQHYLLEKIIAASPSGIIILNFDNGITAANPKACKILNLEQAKLQTLALNQLPKPFATVLPALQEGQAYILTLDNRIIVRCSRSSFFDQGFSRSFIHLEELTEEVRASEKAAFEKAIRVLSHEVNNSIGAANSLLHSLLHYKQQLGPEDQEDFEMAIRVVISRTDHLNNFMRGYVDVIRLPDPVTAPVNLKQLLQQTVALFESELTRREIIVEWEWQIPDNQEIDFDEGQMGQVLVNILKNAIEAIERDGTIKISCRNVVNGYQLSISDSGTGIPEEAKDQLFSPYFSTKQNGQGIGLALVQEVLQRHGFLFSLTNNEGAGSTFVITFSKN